MDSRCEVSCSPTGFSTMLVAMAALWVGEALPTVPSPLTGQPVVPMEAAEAARLLNFPRHGECGRLVSRGQVVAPRRTISLRAGRIG